MEGQHQDLYASSCGLKLKTEEKATTLHQLKTDISNQGKICLGSGLKMSFGRPVKLPLIRRRTNCLDSVLEQCQTSRIIEQNTSLVNLKNELKEYLHNRQMLGHELGVSPQPHELHQHIPKKHVGSSLSRVDEQLTHQEVIPSETGRCISRKALPRIFRQRYMKEGSMMSIAKSSSSVAKSQAKEKVDRFKMGNLLGNGAYSVVRAAINQQGQHVAIKTYDKGRLDDGDKKQSVKREVDILRKVSHPNIICFYEATETTNTLNIVTEIVHGHSLSAELKSAASGHLTQIQALRIIKQLLKAIAYLHSKRIAHRDIKLDNILINNQKEIKLIDFGFSIETDAILHDFCGTPNYMAPEILTKQGYEGKPADVWSCGIVLFKLLTGFYPFKGKQEKQLFGSIIRGEFRLPINVSSVTSEIISRMLSVNAVSRPTAQDLLEQQWLNCI